MRLAELKSESATADATALQSEGGKDAATATAAETVVLAPEGSPSPSVETPPSEPLAEEAQFQSETVTTPSGLEILYSWAPKRLYRLNGDEVPSVTNILGVLDKPGLVWWGQRIGVEGILELIKRNRWYPEPELKLFTPPELAAELVAMLTEQKLTVNHQRDKAAVRGVNVHSVLEGWAPGEIVTWDQYPEHEQGYVKGLADFLLQIEDAVEFGSLDMEVMVGSLEHRYAGRYDLRLTLTEPVEIVTKCYPKKDDKVEVIPAGKWLIDLKTSKKAHDTYQLQLQAYEKASVECGYEPTDHQAVLRVTADGQYEFVRNTDWTAEDFLAVRAVYSVFHERENLKNERAVEQALRDELGATNVG